MTVTPIPIRGLLFRFRFSKGTIFLVFIAEVLTVGTVFVAIPICDSPCGYGRRPCFGLCRLDGFLPGVHCLVAWPQRELLRGRQGLR
jgi:hypothetical protein